MSLIDTFLHRNRNSTSLIDCIGDAMIDQYYNVKVNRISPEFPMPIIHSEDDNPILKLGGVANVAHQLKYFNCNSKLIAFSDYNINEICYNNNINIISLPLVGIGEQIPIKKRFLDNGVQVNRWDIEKPFGFGISDKVREELHATIIESYNTKPQVAILSDYNKGFFDRKSISLYMEHLKDQFIIVDPKKGPIDKWIGCTLFKPNSLEAKELSGFDDWHLQCKYFCDSIKCRGVVITQGSKGVVGVWDNEFFDYKPKNNILIDSVVGAGDCFVAVLALAIALDFSVKEAAEIACEASSLYVQNRMNKPIHPVDLSNSRIILPQDLTNRDFKLAFTNGCFDIIHSGHLHTLEIAKSKADKLVVGINSDESVRSLKGEKRPIKPLEERLKVMASLRMVDYVFSFDELTPLKAIELCKPDVLVKGGDYQEDQIVGRELVKEVYSTSFVENISTTQLIENYLTK